MSSSPRKMREEFTKKNYSFGSHFMCIFMQLFFVSIFIVSYIWTKWKSTTIRVHYQSAVEIEDKAREFDDFFFRAVYELICDPQSTSIGESRRAVRAFKTFSMLHSKLIFIIMRLWKSYANNSRHARTHTHQPEKIMKK